MVLINVLLAILVDSYVATLHKLNNPETIADQLGRVFKYATRGTCDEEGFKEVLWSFYASSWFNIYLYIYSWINIYIYIYIYIYRCCGRSTPRASLMLH